MTRNGPVASRGAATAASLPPHSASPDEQIAVSLGSLLAAAAWNGKAAKPSIRKRLCGGPSCAVSDIAVGHCRQCRRRLRGPIGLQTSDAVGIGKVQLKPEALTLSGDPE